MKRVAKFQEGGTASSGISNEPVGAALRRLFQRRAPMQGPLAPGGGQRPQEDRARMAEEAAPRFDEEERRYMEGRRNQGSAITNQPVGERLAGRRSAPRPAPMGDYEDRMQRGALPAGRSAAPGPMGEYGERAAAGATPPRPRATPRPMAREATTAEDLNEIVLRLTRGEKPVTETEKRIADRMGIAYRKGGMVKDKTAMKKEAPKMMMKKGGKVAPKKMMKGGIVAKPKAKKMMGGGRAMYAKGGMAKGCK